MYGTMYVWQARQQGGLLHRIRSSPKASNGSNGSNGGGDAGGAGGREAEYEVVLLRNRIGYSL